MGVLWHPYALIFKRDIMVSIENITVEFHTKESSFKAIDSVNLNIEDGEVFGIVGTSGAGKSTLLRTINLLQKPTSGKIVIDTVDITDFSGAKLREVRQKNWHDFSAFQSYQY